MPVEKIAPPTANNKRYVSDLDVVKGGLQSKKRPYDAIFGLYFGS